MALRRVWSPLEALVFLGVEAYVILRYPGLYLYAQRRARRKGRFAFHAFPRSCNEKFLWRKVFDHDPRFVRLSDKLAVRDWLEEVGCSLPSAPLLWVGDRSTDMPAELRHAAAVLKSNHATGHVIMLDECDLSDAEIDKLTQGWLAYDHSTRSGEWGYRDVPHKIFVEGRIGSPGAVAEDWKFYTFGARVERIVHMVRTGDGRGGQVFEPDGDGGLYRLERAPSAADFKLEGPKPPKFETLLAEARKLGAHFDHMRVDYLSVGDTAVMGEMTVYNLSGWVTEGGEDPNKQISRAWDLRRSWFLTEPRRSPFARLYAWTLQRALDRRKVGEDLPPA